jgi:hypothetical protein
MDTAPMDAYFSPVGEKLINIAKWERKKYEVFHEKLLKKEIPYFKVSGLGGAVECLKNAGVGKILIISADETIRTFRVVVRYWGKVSILKVESKFGLVRELGFDLQKNEYTCGEGGCWFSFAPEDLGSARDILYFHYIPIDAKVEDEKTKQVIRKVYEKRRDFENALFHAELMDKSLKRANSVGGEYDLILVLIDGPLLPPHLDPHVGPGTRLMLDVWKLVGQDEMTKLLEMKEYMLRTYLSIFERVLGSGGIVLVGAVKRSEDQTLQYKVFRHVEEGRSDVDVLISYLKGGEGIGPYFIDRLSMFAKELRRFNIKRLTGGEVKREVPVHSYMVRMYEYVLPMRLDVLTPPALRGMEQCIVDFLANLIVPSRKHTYIAGVEEGILLKVPTLFPIYLVDNELDMWGVFVESVYRAEIEKAWEVIKNRLFRAYRGEKEVEIGYFKKLRNAIEWGGAL